MNKRDVIKQIQEYLQGELAGAEKLQDQQRAEELKRLITIYRFLPARDLGPQDVVCPAALVELELNGAVTFCFIAPQGGGLITAIEGKAIQVITPYSPLGEALLGKRAGDTVIVASRQGQRRYTILNLA